MHNLVYKQLLLIFIINSFMGIQVGSQTIELYDKHPQIMEFNKLFCVFCQKLD